MGRIFSLQNLDRRQIKPQMHVRILDSNNRIYKEK